jgi:hypothetical protein
MSDPAEYLTTASLSSIFKPPCCSPANSGQTDCHARSVWFRRFPPLSWIRNDVPATFDLVALIVTSIATGLTAAHADGADNPTCAAAVPLPERVP